MADTQQTKKLEREYTINLRRELLQVPQYERSGRAIKAIKKFIAKHMKVPDRDVKNVKLDVYFNNEIWYRGRTNPPTKVRVKAIKEGDIVRVNFVDIPQHIKFAKAKIEKMHKKAEKKAAEKPAEAKPEPVSPEQKPAEKTEEQKKDEVEKEKSGEVQNIQEAKMAEKAQKHTTKVKPESYHRVALKK